jgi:hypothetical protein
MSKTILRLTEFHEQKLQCIGGQGSFSPYQVTRTCGGAIGVLGSIIEPSTSTAINADSYEHPNSRLGRTMTGLVSKFRRQS